MEPEDQRRWTVAEVAWDLGDDGDEDEAEALYGDSDEDQVEALDDDDDSDEASGTEPLPEAVGRPVTDGDGGRTS